MSSYADDHSPSSLCDAKDGIDCDVYAGSDAADSDAVVSAGDDDATIDEMKEEVD
jgi:hypothetical protein